MVGAHTITILYAFCIQTYDICHSQQFIYRCIYGGKCKKWWVTAVYFIKIRDNITQICSGDVAGVSVTQVQPTPWSRMVMHPRPVCFCVYSKHNQNQNSIPLQQFSKSTIFFSLESKGQARLGIACRIQPTIIQGTFKQQAYKTYGKSTFLSQNRFYKL